MKHLKTYTENQLIKDYLSDDGKILNLSDLDITELPELPQTLKILYCSNNQLTELPELPQTLEILNCYNNQLKELPELPKTIYH